MKNKFIIGCITILVIVFIGLIFNFYISREFSQGSYSNTKPMYGALDYENYVLNRDSERQKADDSFLEEIVEADGSPKAAFKDAISQAWSYIAKKDVDMGMKRCNQAWLIDHMNFNVYWCYGSALDSKQDFEQSALYFDKSISMYSVDAELFTNDYLPLYRDASQTFIHLSDKYLASNQIKAKMYATKAVSLLLDSLNDKNLPEKEIPVVTFMLFAAYFDNGSYSDARKISDRLNEYPEYAKSGVMIKIDGALKNKGF